MDNEWIICNLDGRRVLKVTCKERKLSYCPCDSPTIAIQHDNLKHPRPIRSDKIKSKPRRASSPLGQLPVEVSIDAGDRQEDEPAQQVYGGHPSNERWEGVGFYKFPYLSKKQFKEIARILGVRPSQLGHEWRRGLQVAIRNYASEMHALSNRPRRAEVNASLSKIIKKATDLLEALQTADHMTSETLTWRLKFDPVAQIRQIVSGANAISEILGKDRGGRTPERAPFRVFVKQLYDLAQPVTRSTPSVWTDRNGARDYHGPFFEFVYHCLEILHSKEPEIMGSKAAIGRQISQTLKAIHQDQQ